MPNTQVSPGADGHWYRNCDVCHQTVVNGREGEGPWCELYCEEQRMMCYARAKRLLHEAEARGDGPLVNALCRWGRAKFGEDIDW